MALQRQTKRSFTWAPKALVVISCALALLAVQPSVQANTARHAARPKTVALRDGGLPVEHTTEPRHMPSLGMPAANTKSDIFASAQHFHVLATVEILHRLLLSELQVPQTHFLPVIWFQPICIEVLPPLSQPTRPAPAAGDESPPPIERAFALHHCLLAPPLS